MKESLRKYSIMCTKNIVDFFKNPALSLGMVLPILFVFLYKMINLPNLDSANRPAFLLNLGTLLNCCMCGLLIASTSIAEEKEKFTLRTLMLSNVSGMEFLASKVTVGYLLTMLGNLIIFVLSGSSVKNLVFYLPATLLGSLAVNLISAVLGLASRDQASCSVLQIPIMMLFLFPSVFATSHSILSALAMVTPLSAMTNLYHYGVNGAMFTGMAMTHLFVLLAWILGSGVLFILVYRKKGLDN